MASNYALLFVIVVAVTATCQPQGPNIISRKDASLPRLEPVKVGYEREIIVFETPQEGASKVTIKTVSVKPPVFTIDNFLSSDECEHLIMYSKRLGFETSPTIKDPDVIDDETSKRTFKHWDFNGDGFIDTKEVKLLPGKRDIYLTDEDVIEMFDELDMDQDFDARISFDEFKRKGVPAIKTYFQKLRKIPHMRSRNSKQAWMFHDNPKYPLLTDFHGRLSRLTGLPKYMIRNSEPVQVVQYGIHGHYHAHHDSDEMNKTLTCCTLYKEENCRLCRYMTVLFFLNEPKEGGQTSFPYANNHTFTESGLDRERNKMNLAKRCKVGNLVIQPKKGMAVMWYNHYREPNTGWLGELDKRTYHGGCDVTEGTKLIANMWLNVIGSANSEESFKGWLHAYENLEGEMATESGTKPKPPETEPAAEMKQAPETKPTPETKPKPETKPEHEAKQEPKTKKEPEMKQEPETKPETETKLETKQEPVTKPELERKQEPETKPEPEIEQEQEVKQEPEVGNGREEL